MYSIYLLNGQNNKLIQCKDITTLLVCDLSEYQSYQGQNLWVMAVKTTTEVSSKWWNGIPALLKNQHLNFTESFWLSKNQEWAWYIKSFGEDFLCGSEHCLQRNCSLEAGGFTLYTWRNKCYRDVICSFPPNYNISAGWWLNIEQHFPF